METLLAVALYAWLTYHFRSTLFIDIAVVTAPLLLLRTPAMTRIGIRRIWDIGKRATWSDLAPIERAVEPETQVGFGGDLAKTISLLVTLFPIYACAAPFVLLSLIPTVFLILVDFIRVLVIKILTVTLCFCRNPIRSFQELPRNLGRILFRVDSLHRPELVPGAIFLEEKQGIVSPLDPLAFAWVGLAYESGPDRDKTPLGFRPLWLFHAAGICLTYLTFAIVSTLYRWSLKGTFLVWSPLWLLVGDNRELQPSHIADGDFFSKFLPKPAGLFALWFLLDLLGFVRNWLRAIPKDVLSAVGVLPSFIEHVASHSHPMWQWACFCSSLLVLVTRIYAHRLKLRGCTRGQRRRLYGFLYCVGLSFVVLSLTSIHAIAPIIVARP